MDSLPKFRVAQEAGFDMARIDHVIVNKLPSPFQHESIFRLGLRAEQVVETTGFGQRFMCERLLACTPIRTAWAASDAVYEWTRGPAGPAFDMPERVFILRGNRGRRRLTNEGDLLDALGKVGFVAIDPEELGLAGALGALRHARIVVGGHGAGLANIVGSTRLAAMVEMHGPHCALEILSTASALGGRHFTVGGESAFSAVEGPLGIDSFLAKNASNYQVNEEILLAAVEAAIEVGGR
jgi:capsular polysaccharide biosynthesis protein